MSKASRQQISRWSRKYFVRLLDRKMPIILGVSEPFEEPGSSWVCIVTCEQEGAFRSRSAGGIDAIQALELAIVNFRRWECALIKEFGLALLDAKSMKPLFDEAELAEYLREQTE